MRWASAFLNRTVTKLCAMIGKAVARRIPMGPTRAEAPERSGRRILIQDVHACHHARGELRVCQARIMHIQRRGIPHRCHVRAHAALSTWRIEHMAQCDLRQRCSHNALSLTSHSKQTTCVETMIWEQFCRVCHPAAPRLALASVLSPVSTGGLSRGEATNSVGPSFFEANGYKI